MSTPAPIVMGGVISPAPQPIADPGAPTPALAARLTAISTGAKACPRCDTGWFQYLVSDDSFTCSNCGFKRQDAPYGYASVK